MDPKLIQRVKEQLNHFSDKSFESTNQKAVFSEDKILFLDTILCGSVYMTDDKKEKYIQAIMFVQTALDIHDFVPIHSIEQNQIIPRKQMNVLVGDLYSGKFYEILSNLENIEFIAVLASAIRSINERKMVIYYSDGHSINHLVEELKEVESALIIHVCQYFNINEYNEVIQNWLLMKRLMMELYTYQKEKKSVVLNLLSQRYTEHDVIRMVENMIPRIMIKLEALIHDLPSEVQALKSYLMKELKELSLKQGILLGEG
ncbi:heptaprenyl diphosphate synthase [Salinibacillus kushneri]|uniref:Heptaprenyl diphosphate synthase n=1 Tax=Salinibacillus kushneri TaxID=237682 RepID=A0A1I0I1G6_9BACI|nr:heptaprenyl diphosphate synthase component 1 [Salinibacillus kushneri]SET90095.1 heptaprenyl diphosphate synthase [Salinibacillus kushneri]